MRSSTPLTCPGISSVQYTMLQCSPTSRRNYSQYARTSVASPLSANSTPHGSTTTVLGFGSTRYGEGAISKA